MGDSPAKDAGAGGDLRSEAGDYPHSEISLTNDVIGDVTPQGSYSQSPPSTTYYPDTSSIIRYTPDISGLSESGFWSPNPTESQVASNGEQ